MNISSGNQSAVAGTNAVIIKVGNHANKIIIMVGFIISFMVVLVTRAPRYKRGAAGGCYVRHTGIHTQNSGKVNWFHSNTSYDWQQQRLGMH